MSPSVMMVPAVSCEANNWILPAVRVSATLTIPLLFTTSVFTVSLFAVKFVTTSLSASSSFTFCDGLISSDFPIPRRNINLRSFRRIRDAAADFHTGHAHVYVGGQANTADMPTVPAMSSARRRSFLCDIHVFMIMHSFIPARQPTGPTPIRAAQTQPRRAWRLFA